MPTKNLTEKRIKTLEAPDPSGKQVLWWDSGGEQSLKGFGVLCSGTTKTKSYVVQRYLPGRSSPRRFTIGSVNELSLKEARDKAAKVLQGMREGRDPKAGRLGTKAATLRQVLDGYLAARKSLAPRSAEHYRSLVERHLADWLDRPLREITPEMVEARHGRIAEEIEARHRASAARDADKWTRRAEAAEARGWSEAAAAHRARAAAARERKPTSGHATANAVMVAVRTLWNFQVHDDSTLPAKNPVQRLRLKRMWFKVRRRKGEVRADDLPKFYTAVLALANPVHRDYLLLLLFTGFRRREAAALTWDEVDLGARVIRIPAERMKSKEDFDLPMSDFVFNIFLERQRLGREKFVFPADSKSGHIEEPKFPLKQIADTTGIKVSAHDLRRTFSTAAESCEISTITLKALIAHALPKGTTEEYPQLHTERLRRSAQRIANKLKKLCGIAPAGGKNVVRLRRPAA